MNRTIVRGMLAFVFLATLAGFVSASETENLNMKILPVPGKVAIDGNIEDWDLSNGIFCCGDVENQRDKYAIWIHAMWDANNVYILARWIDLTPMTNPGSIKGDYGFNGDCLQVRFVTAPADKLAEAATREGSHDTRPDLPGKTPVVDNDGSHGPKEESGSIQLKAGKHALTVYYIQGGDGSALSASYEGPDIPKGLIPANVLWHDAK